MNSRSARRPLLLLLCSLLSIWPHARADEPAIKSVTYFLTTGQIPVHMIRVEFSGPVPADIAVQAISVSNAAGVETPLSLPSARNVEIVAQLQRLEIDMAEVALPPDAESVTVALISKGNTLTATGTIVQNGTVKSFKTAQIQKFNKATETAKTGTDKSLLAGMDIAIPSGSSNGTQGNADLSFNKEWGKYQFLSGTAIDQFVLGGVLKKSSSPKADARSFQIGAKVRKDVLLAGRNDIRIIQHDPTSQAALDATNRLGKHAFNALFLEGGLNFEGDVKGISIGNISNFVAAFDARLVSPNYANGNGYAAVRFEPAGFEGGYNVQNTEAPNTTNTGIARYKAGLVSTFAYKFDTSKFPLARVELELDGVDRYLFTTENQINTATNVVTKTASGNHYYAEGSFRVFFAQTFWGRVGVQGSFKRGGLPPTFADTRAATVGFIYSTADDTRSSTPQKR